MPILDYASLPACVVELERLRESRVLVLGASHLDLELLPCLYDRCRDIGRVPRLDVVLHGRGGVVNAARRIALLLRQQAEHLAFIVPFHCESSATLLTLCGDEILAGELALFSPIDPQLSGVDGSTFSGLDVELFGQMAERWFGIDAASAREQSLALLCNSVFPPSLTAFYRTTLELAQIGEELLAFQLPAAEPAFRQQLVQRLMSGYHSHNYALTRDEMERLGLRIRRNPAVEQLGWTISKLLQASVGGGLRASAEETWIDALLATRDGVDLRRRQPGGLAPIWTEAPVGS